VNGLSLTSLTTRADWIDRVVLPTGLTKEGLFHWLEGPSKEGWLAAPDLLRGVDRR